MDKVELISEILKLKRERNAIIVAHNYQVDEVQEIADVTGDSLALSKYCAADSSDVIVFCGVHFMAESAKILSPQKTVLLPEADAGCPMADMVTPEALREEKMRRPGAAVVCYINSSAEVKAESDICCTSSNAVKVVRSIKEKDILFIPDRNLGTYVAGMVPDKNVFPWNGYCITHHRIREDEVKKIKGMHPDALILVHPECRPEVTAMADFVGSTKQIIDFASKSDRSKFIIGTEMGVLHTLKKNNPHKTFYLLSQGLVCPNMKKTTLMSVYRALKDMRHEIAIDEGIRTRAYRSLERMMEVG